MMRKTSLFKLMPPPQRSGGPQRADGLVRLVLALVIVLFAATARADLAGFTTNRTDYLNGVPEPADWKFTGFGSQVGQGNNGDGGAWTEWTYNLANNAGDAALATTAITDISITQTIATDAIFKILFILNFLLSFIFYLHIPPHAHSAKIINNF